MKLYDITNSIIEVLGDNEEELNHDALANLEMQLDEKVENCVAYMKNLRAEEEALNTEIKRLTAMRNARKNKRESIGAYVKAELESLKMFGFGKGIHQARIAKSNPSVIVEDEHAIRDQFVEIETKVDKRAILQWHKETGEVPRGVDIVQNTHLRIS